MHTLEQLDLIRQKAPLFSNAVRQSADAARNDAEFISEAEKEIDRLAEQMGVELVRRREYTLAYGRADAVYNRFIIGYEPPGSLRESLQHGGTQHAVQQVKDYILGVSEAEGYKAERVLGVAFDGHYFIYVRYHEGTFHVEPPQMVNGQSAIRFLTTLFSISSERALIPENLVADFGGQSITARRAIGALYRALGEPSPLTEQLYRQWKLFFSEVAGYEAAEGKLEHKKELNALAKGIGVEPAELGRRTSILFRFAHILFLGDLLRGVLTMPHAQGPVLLPLTETGG